MHDHMPTGAFALIIAGVKKAVADHGFSVITLDDALQSKYQR